MLVLSGGREARLLARGWSLFACTAPLLNTTSFLAIANHTWHVVSATTFLQQSHAAILMKLDVRWGLWLGDSLRTKLLMKWGCLEDLWWVRIGFVLRQVYLDFKVQGVCLIYILIDSELVLVRILWIAFSSLIWFNFSKKLILYKLFRRANHLCTTDRTIELLLYSSAR